MMAFRVALSWPSALSPNRIRGSYRKTVGPRKAAKDEAYVCALAASRGLAFDPGAALPLQLIFHPPDKARRDLDNCLAMMKASIDGCALAMRIDDRMFRPITIDWGDPVRGGKVVLLFGAKEAA